MKKMIVKKKFFVMLDSVKDFMREQPGDVKQELNGIIYRLETTGMLTMPYGEKIVIKDPNKTSPTSPVVANASLCRTAKWRTRGCAHSRRFLRGSAPPTTLPTGPPCN